VIDQYFNYLKVNEKQLILDSQYIRNTTDSKGKSGRR